MLHYEQLCGENCFKTDIDFANINTMYNEILLINKLRGKQK